MLLVVHMLVIGCAVGFSKYVRVHIKLKYVINMLRIPGKNIVNMECRDRIQMVDMRIKFMLNFMLGHIWLMPRNGADL